MSRSDLYASLVIGGIFAGAVGALFGIVYGLVTVAKWAWGN